MAEIKAIIIFEMLGRPPEHVKTALADFIDKIGKEEGVKITNKKISEPKRVKNAEQEFYTSFAETEITFDNLNTLLKIVFIGMPSHIEIIYPEEIKLKNFDLNTVVNELTRRLHQYDEIVKRLAIERQMMVKQLQEQAKMLAGKGSAENINPGTREIKGKPRKQNKKKSKKK